MFVIYVTAALYTLWYLITRSVGFVINYQDWMFNYQLEFWSMVRQLGWLAVPLVPESMFIAEQIYYSFQRE